MLSKTITYKINLIYSFRFMSSSLSSHVDNLSEGLYNEKFIDWWSYFEYDFVKTGQSIFKYLKCSKN